jgi:alpha-L-fucosidase 2
VIGDVIWSSPGQSSVDSLPLGNGNLAANVWTEPNGDIVLYLAKNDAWDHLGRLIKIGRLRLKFTPDLTAPGGKFEQKLSLADATISITNGATTVKLWLDAHWPRFVIEVTSTTPCSISASLDPWRTAPRELGVKEAHTACGLEGGPVKLFSLADQIVPHEAAVIWYQRNESSIWPLTLDQQGLGDFKARSADPLLHRTFGGYLSGDGFKKTSDTELTSGKPTTATTLSVTVHAAQTDSVDSWLMLLRAAVVSAATQSRSDLWRDHQDWWRDFWARSYIRPEARAPDWNQAATIGEQSAWQRYLVACCGRGLYPVKFNGGLFTADWGIKDEAFDADYRRWGGGYWWQNTRLIYWALLAHGDYELMRPLFRMYRDMLPLAEQRTQQWYGHGGVFFPETLYFWGTYLPSNYGWDRTGKQPREIENQYIRYYWNSGLELVALLLETFDHTGDTALLDEELLPIARAVMKFCALHYSDDAGGKLRFAPAQSLETWWHTENPMPEVAALHYLLPRLLALPASHLAPTDRGTWRALATRLPAVPTGTVDGKKLLLAAETHEPVPSNTENPELYAVFPYKLYGLGRPGLDLAQWTFARRMFPDTGGWRQDAVQAALLGLTEAAAFYTSKNFNDRTGFPATFKGFWGPNYDWVPDFDHGSVSQLALQTMLVQTVGEKILLFPAWPADRWNVTFKLHVSGQTVVEGELKDGALIHLSVTPAARRKDVVVLLGQNKPASV